MFMVWVVLFTYESVELVIKCIRRPELEVYVRMYIKIVSCHDIYTKNI